jgi:hypothetical protein
MFCHDEWGGVMSENLYCDSLEEIYREAWAEGYKAAVEAARTSEFESYRRGFNAGTINATRAAELAIKQFQESTPALQALKVYMAYLFSGHHYHMPTRYQDAGLALTHGLMRLVGFSGTYFVYDAEAVRNWDELEGN